MVFTGPVRVPQMTRPIQWVWFYSNMKFPYDLAQLILPNGPIGLNYFDQDPLDMMGPSGLMESLNSTLNEFNTLYWTHRIQCQKDFNFWCGSTWNDRIFKKKSGTKLLNFHIARPEFPVKFFAIFAIGVPSQYLPLYLKLSEKSTSWAIYSTHGQTSPSTKKTRRLSSLMLIVRPKHHLTIFQ